MKTFTLPHAEIAYDDRGRSSQPPIVLIHGFPLDRRIWQRVADRLSAEFRVITIDLPGFGNSTTIRSFTMNTLADDLYTVLDKLDATPCTLAGLSMGGYVAGAFAARHANALHRLILTNTKTTPDTAEAKAKRDQMAALAREKGSRAIADQMLPTMLHPDHKEDESLVNEIRTMMESQPSQTLANACVAMRDRDDYTAAIAAVKVPTLIIAGEADAIISRDVSQSTNRSIADSKLVVIPNAGHMTPLENPGEVARHIAEFCRPR